MFINNWSRAPLGIAVTIALAGVAATPVLGAKFNKKVDVGMAAPLWKDLMGVDGKAHNLDDYQRAKVLVIAFTCNQCPVSQLYEERFIRFVTGQKPRGVAFVAVSCSLLPPDRLEKMQERARTKRFNYDYLFDPTQQTGRDYGATVTPQIFVLDQNRHIAYMGKFDDNIEPDKVQRAYVEDAVRSLLTGKQPDPGETRATGCGIEYGKR